MKESDFSHKFVEEIKNKFPYCWGMKIHGHEMQASSIPDYLFCINGIFVGIEFKVQRDGRISITNPGQIRELIKIQNAKGIGIIIAYDEDKNKICFKIERLDYKSLLSNPVKSGNIQLHWDFVFSDYQSAIEVFQVMIESK